VKLFIHFQQKRIKFNLLQAKIKKKDGGDIVGACCMAAQIADEIGAPKSMGTSMDASSV
jgi:hypothetical protein